MAAVLSDLGKMPDSSELVTICCSAVATGLIV